MILRLFIPLFWATVSMLLAAPLSIKVAQRLNLIDVPYSAPHKIHQFPIPKAGGIALAVVVLLLSLLSGRFANHTVRGILLASLVVFLFGLWDDARGLNAGWKLLGQVLATIVLVWQGISIQMLSQQPGGLVLNLGLTFFWVVGITNAFNLVDSMDGLAIGLAAIASAFFMLVTVDARQLPLAYLSAILLGSCIGMSYFNAVPARSFLGDSGAQFLGFVLAALAIAYTPRGLPQPSSWFVPILLLIVPIFDTTFVVVSRMGRGAAFYKAGQDHTYHRLVELGFSSTHAVMTMHVAALLAGCLAFMALPLPPLWANLVFASVLLVGLILLLWLRRKST
jgi:UDP-GlcNAc:undecaprenyl-phosphate GlcNAc-1-phosphate transferase